MSKRRKIVITSIVSATLVLLATILNLQPEIVEIILVMGATYLLSSWALQPDLTGWEYATLLALPTLLTAGVILMAETPDAPVPWKYLVPPIYGAALYVILLVENIFNVSAERQVPLLRAAHTIGYLSTLGVAFLVSTLLFSKELPSYGNATVMFMAGAALVGQALWQIALDETDRKKLVTASLVSALVVGELALAISFWPVHPLGAGLALTTLVYVLIGAIRHDWEGNLKRRTLLEYLLLAALVFTLLFFTTSWGG
jgi:hypothetical protein